jgi:uncharacterized protein YcbK (DUF882 family)
MILRILPSPLLEHGGSDAGRSIVMSSSLTSEDFDHEQSSRVFVWAIAMVLSVLLLSLLLKTGVTDAGDNEVKRFVHMGDGQIRIRNIHTGAEADVQLLTHDGSLDEDALVALDRVFGFSPGPKGDHVSLRLIFLLDYFSDKVAPGRMIELSSGYRSPEYNQKLRSSGGIVAPTSTHMDAMAADFSIEGVDGKGLWETIRKEECGGVGHYGGKVVHLDSGRPRFWEAATSKVNSGESEFNRRIYLSTQYDRYRPGEDVRLTLSSVSHYPFGVERALTIVREGLPDNEAVSQIRGDDECITVSDRAGGRFLYAPLPQSLPSGRYRIRLDFCRIPFPQMPTGTVSNPIDVVTE